MKRLLILIFAVGMSFPAFLQVADYGEPLSWNGKLPKMEAQIKMPFVDVEAQLAIDAENKANGIKMLRFGYEHFVDVDVISKGSVAYTPKGNKVTRLGIVCPNALSVNLIFDQFKLSPNATLYFYNAKHAEYIGAYTATNNNAYNMLGTEIVHGSNVIVELVEPKNEIGHSILNIGTIVHGYLDVEDVVAKALNSSGDCEYDVNCPIGSGWEKQRNAVAMMVNGGGFCTGSLVNNTSGAIIPYFLTANHCHTSSPGGWVFRFRWESPPGQADCATAGPSVNGPETMNVNGAVLRANSAKSDFCLVELNAPPNPAWGIYYNGWDNTGNTPTMGVGIHHPAGDIKKISFEYDPLMDGGWSGTPANSHWRVNWWDKGVTEGGSSGSPLFDQNHRIIGQLHGGNSGCGGSDLSDEYGKFSVSWLGEGTIDTQLKYWLDPDTTGATVISGVDPSVSPNNLDLALLGVTGANGTICSPFASPVVSLQNQGATSLTQATIVYNYNGGTNQQYNWTGNLAPYDFDFITLPTVGHPTGSNTLNVTGFAPNGGTDENPTNDTLTVSFFIVANATDATLTIHPDCFSSETSWEIQRQSDGYVVAHGGTYFNSSTPTDIIEKRCLPVGCYDFVIKDTYGDGMSNSSSSCNQKQGSFELLDMHGDTLCLMTQAQAAFGNSLALPFCVTEASLNIPTYDITTAIKIYPNPATTNVNITLSVEGEKTIRMVDASGKLLYQTSTTQMETSISLLNFENGIYFLHIQTPLGSAVKKVIKK